MAYIASKEEAREAGANEQCNAEKCSDCRYFIHRIRCVDLEAMLYESLAHIVKAWLETWWATSTAHNVPKDDNV